MGLSKNIYPPILNSTQSPFLDKPNETFQLKFQLSKTMSIDEIQGFGVKITYQQNNLGAITPVYTQGESSISFGNTWFIGNKTSIIGPDTSGWYYITIPRSFFGNDIRGKLFKVQMCVTTKFFTITKNGIKIEGDDTLYSYSNWHNQMIKNNYLSGMSNIMLIKCIKEPIVSILNANITSTVVTVVQKEFSLNPLIIGQVELFDDEYLDQYRFILYDSTGAEIDNSNWLQNDSYADITVSYRFKQTLQDNTEYSVSFDIITGSEYQSTAQHRYNFSTSSSILGDLKYWKFQYEETEFDRENACATLQLKYKKDLIDILGKNYLILRTSQDSGFSVWEPLKYFMIDSENQLPFDKGDNGYYYFRDFTVECGKKYKYGLVEENNIGSRTNIYEITGFDDKEFKAQTVQIFFEYSYIFANGIQLRLPFDCELSSFKRTKLQSKVNTIGSKYPTICVNGMANYAEFPISATISILSDEYDTFIQKNEDGMYQNGDLLFSTDFFEQLEKRTSCEIVDQNNETYRKDVTTNNNDDNTLYERIFRETVLDFLGNDEPKLFKSSTEGNLIIGLINVSTSPVESVNRMIVKLSATAYEIMDNTLKNMDEYSIINIGAYKNEIDLSRVGLGQLSGCFIGTKTREENSITDTQENKQDLIKIIKTECNSVTQGNLQRSFKRLKSFWIELHPDIDNYSEIEQLNHVLPECILRGKIGDNEWNTLTKTIVPFYATSVAKSSGVPAEMGLYELNVSTQEFFLSTDTTWQDKQYYWNYQDSDLYQRRSARKDLLQKIEDNRTMANAISTVPMIINDKKIYVGINQIYSFDDTKIDINSLYFDFTTPVVFNYTYEYSYKNAEKETVLSEDRSEIFGQLTGIFTLKENTLYAYDLGFEDRETETLSFPVDSNGVKQNHWDVFRTSSISKVIRERCMKRIYDAYGCSGVDFEDASKDDNDNQRYYYQSANWGLYYSFGDFIALKFEGQPGTDIVVRYLQDTTIIEKHHYINESYIIVIKPSNNLKIIDFYINDETNSNKFLIVDYICQTRQTKVATRAVSEQ